MCPQMIPWQLRDFATLANSFSKSEIKETADLTLAFTTCDNE